MHRYEQYIQDCRELHAWWIARARDQRRLGNLAGARFSLRRCAESRKRIVVYVRQLKLIGSSND